jgi:COPI associated protein
MVNVSFASVTVSGYVVFFGLLLTCLECQIGNLAPKFRKNFGFMFSFAGRTIFIIFCATMLFALNAWLGYLAGALTAVNGLFNGYVICVHPSFRSGELKASADPFGGYTGGETEMLKYLQKNPQLANKAAGVAVQYAKENPQVALQVVQAGAKAQPEAESNPWAPK